MKRNKLLINSLIIISLSCVTFSMLSLFYSHKNKILQNNAAAEIRTLTCSNFSQFVSNGYLKTSSGNKINFYIHGCSGNTISLGGGFYNTTKFARIASITVNFNSPAYEHLNCYYGSNSNPKYNAGMGVGLESGYSESINASYIEIDNTLNFNNTDMTISSFIIKYEC